MNPGARLYKAAQAGDFTELSKLLRNGVDPNVSVLAKLPSDRPRTRSGNGAAWQWTTVRTSALFAAADHDQLDAARALLDSGERPSHTHTCVRNLMPMCDTA